MGTFYCCYTVRTGRGQAKGKAKTVAGAATGNERLEAEGHLDQAKVKAKNALKGAKKSVKKKTRY